MKLFGKTWTRRALMERIGHVSQVGGIRRFTMVEGPERGVEVARLDTGTGFAFTVLLNRGLDVYEAHDHGQSLSWHSATGAPHPAHCDLSGRNWLKTFQGGLVTTCGMGWAGAACIDEGQELGLHGRASSLSAEHLTVAGDWEGDEYVMRVEGQLREAEVFGTNFLLKRRITARLGEPRLTIEDEVENEGWDPQPHMMLYHCNFGYPLLSEETRLVIPATRTVLRETKQPPPKAMFLKVHSPRKGFAEEVFYHTVPSGKTAEIRLEKRGFGGPGGRGAYLRYSRDTLPNLIQWKMTGQGTYVMAFEPANCWVEGRDVDRRNGVLRFLTPGKKVRYRLEIGRL